MVHDVCVRPATEQDVEDIALLQEMWCDEQITWGYVPDTQEGISALIDDQCLVAEGGDGVVGFITWQVIATPDMAALPSGQPCLDITDLYVSPSHRSRGIGGLLLRSLLDKAEADGIQGFRLFSGTKDIARVTAFYERYGFTTVSVSMVRRP